MSIDLFLKPPTDIFNIFIDVIFANKSHCIPKPNHRGHFQQEIRAQLQPEPASSHYYKDGMMMIIMVVLMRLVMMVMMFMVVLMTLMMMMMMVVMVKIIPLPVPWLVPV